MKAIQEELDQQAGELARIARDADAAAGPQSRVELELGRLLQQSMEELYAEWKGNAPPGWPDERVKMLTRVGVQKQALLYLARTLETLGAEDLEKEVDQMLTSAREAMPTALDGKYYETPLIYPPDAMESEFSDLVFETHDQALRLLDDEMERL